MEPVPIFIIGCDNPSWFADKLKEINRKHQNNTEEKEVSELIADLENI